MAEHDERLVEAVADALAAPGGTLRTFEEDARRVLAAIDASGIAWVAPWKMTNSMHGAYNATYHSSAGATWAAMRDACLAERKGEGR